MTAEKSANRITNNFWVNWRQKTWSNRKIIIILFFLHMLAAPANLLNILIYLGFEKKYKLGQIVDCPAFNEFYPVIGVFTTGLAVLAGILIAIVVFQYLYKKSKVDMYYSLPLTTNQRFFSDFLSGITIYLLPFLAAQVFSVILCLAGQIIYSKEFSVNYITGMPDVSWHVKSVLGLLMLMILAGIVLMLLVYTFTVLTMVCCGSQFEVISYTALINVMVPLTPAIFSGILFGSLYGVDSWSEAFPVIERTSPIGGAIGLYEWFSSSFAIPEYFWLIIPMLIFTAALAALSMLLYRKRKAEQVGRPFVFKIFYYILLTSITLCIVCAFIGGSYDPDRLVPMVIVSAICYLIPEVITNRGIKKFYKCLIHYGITITAAVALVFTSQASGGFGIAKYIPSALSVKSAGLNVRADFLDFGITGGFNEEDNIELIREIQKDIIKNNPNGADWRHNSGVSYVDIDYKTITGRNISRYYGGPKISESAKQNMLALERSGENINNIVKELKGPYCYDVNISDISGEFRTIIISKRLYSEGVIKVKDEKEYTLLKDELAEALEKDLLARESEEFSPSANEALFVLNFDFDYKFRITENDRNVLAWLRDHSLYSYGNDF